MIIVAWDPSINHPGYSAVEFDEENEGKPHLISSGTFKMPKKLKDEATNRKHRYKIITHVAEMFYKELEQVIGAIPDFTDLPKNAKRIDRAIIENPTFENSGRGKHLAKTKGLKELYFSAALIVAVTALRNIPYALVTSNQWKETPPPAMHARINQIFPHKEGKWATTDEWEAVGLALWGWAKNGQYSLYGTDIFDHFIDQR